MKITHGDHFQVGKDNVHTALSLIGYQPDLEAAMKFVFGSAFVCPNMDNAKAVTYDDKIQKRTVTLDGNSFDPAGTLTGGGGWWLGNRGGCFV